MLVWFVHGYVIVCLVFILVLHGLVGCLGFTWFLGAWLGSLLVRLLVGWCAIVSCVGVSIFGLGWLLCVCVFWVPVYCVCCG